MGGRLDATNATQPVVSVLTPIDYDHQKWLGHSLTEIAVEKAGIIKPKIPVVSALQPEEAAAVIRARAAECDAPLDFVRQPFDRFPIALSGTPSKTERRARALRAAHRGDCGRQCGDRTRIGHRDVAGAFSTLGRADGYRRRPQSRRARGFSRRPGVRSLATGARLLLLAVLQDKDVAGICNALAPIMRRALLPSIRSARALPPEELRLTICDQLPGIPVATPPSFAAAWDEAQRDAAPILITGSLHFAGEALAFLRGEPAAFEECLQ